MLSRFFQPVFLMGTLLLILVWPVPHTIAIRNLLIFSLLFIGIYLFFALNLKQYLKTYLLCFLGLLFLWMIAHYLFFSHSPTHEWQELKSTSLRAFIGFFIALCFAALIKSKQISIHWISIVFYAYPFGIFLIYCYQSYESGLWLAPNDFLGKNHSNDGINKVNPAFLGSIAVAIAYANLAYLFRKSQSIKLNLISLHSIGLIIAFSASIVVNTKNGVGIGLLLTIVFFAYLVFSFFRNIKTSLSLLVPMLIVLTIGFFVWNKHSSSASPGWGSIIQDVKTSIQLDKYPNWQNTPKFGMPLNELNQPVAWNTYERFAWASKGVDLIVKYPLGYGTLTHQSFPALLKFEGVSIVCPMLTCGTHSGWVDFGLAYGVPGLMVLLLTIAFGIYYAFRQKDAYASLAGWLFLVALIAPTVQEIAMKHLFEIWIFIIALGVGFLSNSAPNSSGDHGISQ